MEASISKSPLELQILQLCDSLMAPLGFRVVDLDCRVSGRSLLRVFIERVGGETPSLEDCSRVSRTLSEKLDEGELIPGSYDLEVSSPGLDRRLRLESDFLRAKGQEIRLKLFERLPGRGANVAGKITKVETGNVWVEVDQEEVAIALPKVKQANIVWQAPSGK